MTPFPTRRIPAALAPLALGAAALITAGLVGASAPRAPQDENARGANARACFLPQSIRNYRTDGETTLYVRDLRGGVFQLQTGGCRGLSFSRSLALSPQFGATACVGDTLTIGTVGPSTMGENNSVCRATVTARLDEAQVAALPDNARP